LTDPNIPSGVAPGPIGVFDSGLGGLSVLRAFEARLPDQAFVYLGDHANAPYGDRPAEEIRRLTMAGVERLFDEGCDLVILACNTASAVALRWMQEKWLPFAGPEQRVLGVFVPVIEALTGRNWGYLGPPTPARVKRVALFATEATVASGAFTRELRLRATGVEVLETSCPGLVDALEGGQRGLAEEIAELAVQHALKTMPFPDAAVLGCTHYPLVEDAFRDVLPDETEILSQPEIAAESLADYLVRHPRFAGAKGEDLRLTTGDPGRVTAQARALLGAHRPFQSA